MCTTLIPLALNLYLMYLSLPVSYWLTLALSVPAAGLLVRTFIIMHDCGHGSFFPSRMANDIVGFFTGVLVLTPYKQWRRDHAIHHATSGDLEHRGHGDVTTLTVNEYLALSRWERFRYRVYRNPIVLFGIGPIVLAVKQRLPTPGETTGRKEKWSVWLTNLAIVVLVVLFSLLIGFWSVVMIYAPVFMISGAIGIWLFYVQHQFEDTYWDRRPEWEYPVAALHGSSYFKLPAVLQWFTGNIGLHHVHHLSPLIPNYKLQDCHEENPVFQQVTTLTLWASLKTLSLKLWDEEKRKLIGWRDLKTRQS